MIGKKRKAYMAMKEVAKKEGVSLTVVMERINEAIEEAYLRAHNEGNSEILEKWRDIPCDGDIPTALEMIVYLAEQVNNQFGE